jgi:hypothetical protein
LQGLLLVEGVRGHAHPPPLLPVAFVELLQPCCGVNQRHSLSLLVEPVLLAALRFHPLALTVELPVGNQNMGVRVLPRLVLVDRVCGRIAAIRQLAGNEGFHRLPSLLGGELAGQGHHDLLRRPRVHRPLMQFQLIEQHGRILEPFRSPLGQEGMGFDDPLTPTEPVVRDPKPLIPDLFASDVRQDGA